MSDTVSIVVGLAISLLLIRWIYFSKDVDVTDERVGFLSEDSVLELLAMFPNIPPQEVRLQATRSQSMQAAIDRLLVLSERFPPSVSISRESITSPARSSIPVSIPSMPVHVETVSTEEWLRDANIRQRLQQQRKQYLAQQAFKRYTEKVQKEKTL